MIKATVLCAASLLLAGSLCAQQKRRVAVVNFDYSTVSSNVASIFNTNVDVGKGVADLIVDRLVTTGVFQVYERKAIEKILSEQNFSNSDRANPATAAKIGQLVGVDAVIIGSITQFGRDDKTTEVSGLSRVTGRYGIGGVGKKEAKAVVGLSARVVSVDTAEVLAVASGAGESTRSGTALLGAGGGRAATAGGAYDITSKNFASTILGEAVNKAVDQLSHQLDSSATRVTARTIRIQGLIADAQGNNLIINVGSKAGVRIGDVLEVQRPNREVTDPESGRVIRRITDTLGTLKITEVEELSAAGVFTGANPPKVGDMVRSPK